MSNAAPNDFTVPGPTATVEDRHSRRTAILTVLFWNLLPTILLVAAIAGMMGSPENPSGWEGLVLVIYLVLGGGGLVLSTCLGVAVASVVVGRRLRGTATGTSSPSITRGQAILIGSLSALGGWLLGFLAIVLFIGFTRVAA